MSQIKILGLIRNGMNQKGFHANLVSNTDDAKRVTGTDAGNYLLAGPHWHGKVPEGITNVLRFETDLVLGIGRTQLLSDADGNKLNGVHKYQLTFTGEPPNDAFWSVTMYNTLKDGTGGFLVENPINRYLVNNRTDELIKRKDGSLTITLQHDEPSDPMERANWLPAPEGDFYLIMRIYMPKQSVLDGTWQPPVVRRITLDNSKH